MALREVILEDKAIYMVFEYAEHDFLVSLGSVFTLSYPEVPILSCLDLFPSGFWM